MLTESGFFKEEWRDDPKRATRSSVPPSLVPGRRIASGKYELLRKIGVGAMGEVWAAKHLSLDEEIAIKLVLRDVHHDDGSTADGRFLVEARVARMLSRKTRHVVSVTDHGCDGDMAYLVMELLNGEPLDRRLSRSGSLPIEKVLPIVKQVSRALAVAHGEGIVHRDLKPGNVFLTLDEEGHPLIKILDFGIAKLTADPEEASRNSDAPPPIGVSAHEAKQKTLRGFLLGTPAYMSPEQARGKSVDQRADVWALAVITYHLLTAQFPFDGKDAEELFRRLVRVEAYPVTDHRQDLPAAISDLFEKAFAKRIEDRFATADAFAKALKEAAGNRAPAKLSLPPPTVPIIVGPAANEGESSIIAAGVPRRGGHKPLALGALLLALLGMGSLGYQHLSHGDARGAGLTAGAQSSLDTGARATLTRSDEPIPPPEPLAPVPMQASLPVVTPAALPPPATPPLEPHAPSLPIEEPAVVAAPAPAPAPPAPVARKPIDKSEVF